MKTKKDIVYDRTIKEALFVVYTKCTIRDVAKAFNVSKSCSHKDLNERLKRYNINLYKQVRMVLDENYKNRHIRGGISTRNKYMKEAI